MFKTLIDPSTLATKLADPDWKTKYPEFSEALGKVSEWVCASAQ